MFYRVLFLLSGGVWSKIKLSNPFNYEVFVKFEVALVVTGEHASARMKSGEMKITGVRQITARRGFFTMLSSRFLRRGEIQFHLFFSSVIDCSRLYQSLILSHLG